MLNDNRKKQEIFFLNPTISGFVLSGVQQIANGYLVGACLAHHYPHELYVVDFNPGQSPSSKKGNWEFVQKFLHKRGFAFRKEDIDCLCTVSVMLWRGGRFARG